MRVTVFHTRKARATTCRSIRMLSCQLLFLNSNSAHLQSVTEELPVADSIHDIRMVSCDYVKLLLTEEFICLTNYPSF